MKSMREKEMVADDDGHRERGVEVCRRESGRRPRRAAPARIKANGAAAAAAAEAPI